jgi:hypothetical protein
MPEQECILTRGNEWIQSISQTLADDSEPPWKFCKTLAADSEQTFNKTMAEDSSKFANSM